jgi:hypothetical protein
LYLLFLVSVTCFLVWATALVLRTWSIEVTGRDPGIPPWWWIIGVPVGAVVGLGAVIAVRYALEAVEYLVFLPRKCPHCGKRRWSWGYTQGFGL